MTVADRSLIGNKNQQDNMQTDSVCYAAGRLSVVPALLWGPWELPHCPGRFLSFPHTEQGSVTCESDFVQRVAACVQDVSRALPTAQQTPH